MLNICVINFSRISNFNYEAPVNILVVRRRFITEFDNPVRQSINYVEQNSFFQILIVA
jgi:hypothetical protein